MRTGHTYLSALTLMAFAALSPSAFAAGGPADIAIQYHFTGTTKLSSDNNFARAQSIFAYPPARIFEDFVLDRLSVRAAAALKLGIPGATESPLRPAFNDLLGAESVGTFGGTDKAHMDFVVALRADAKSVATWENAFSGAAHAKGEAISFNGFSGRQWLIPNSHPVWELAANNWLVVGSGTDLNAVRDQYLAGIKKDNFPAPVSKDAWLSADVDWPLLSRWATLADGPFKLARTKVDVTVKNGRMHTIASVKYPNEIPWKAQPWRVPRELMNGPLSSFTASQDLAAYLNVAPGLSQLASSPLTNQFFCWAAREMILETSGAWPVADPTNAVRKLGVDGPVIMNPLLASRGDSQLKWSAKKEELVWTPIQLTSPALAARHGKDGDFVFAEMFPKIGEHTPVPEQLLNQFDQNQSLVYYDWELTGLRLQQWRLLSELLPVTSTPSAEDKARWQNAAKTMKRFNTVAQPKTPTDLVDTWLAQMCTPILDNTVTQVTRTSPTELSVVRNSELLFTGVELVYLSHWLADAPMGPPDGSLLPWAKMTGPGASLLHK